MFVERLWKTVKCQYVYLHAYESVSDARAKHTVYIDFYISGRPHSSVERTDAGDIYFDTPLPKLAA